MEKKKKKDETLEQYRKFYPDTTVTEMTVLGPDKAPTDKEVLEMVKMLCQMTKSMPLYYEMSHIKWSNVSGETKVKDVIRVYKSKEFLKVCDKMSKKGCKVQYFDPDAPGTTMDGEMAEDYIYYMGGCPMVHIESADAGLTSDLDSFAVWWRPVEE